jgi:hypothetical protein
VLTLGPRHVRIHQREHVVGKTVVDQIAETLSDLAIGIRLQPCRGAFEQLAEIADDGGRVGGVLPGRGVVVPIPGVAAVFGDGPIEDVPQPLAEGRGRRPGCRGGAVDGTRQTRGSTTGSIQKLS